MKTGDMKHHAMRNIPMKNIPPEDMRTKNIPMIMPRMRPMQMMGSSVIKASSTKTTIAMIGSMQMTKSIQVTESTLMMYT